MNQNKSSEQRNGFCHQRGCILPPGHEGMHCAMYSEQAFEDELRDYDRRVCDALGELELLRNAGARGK